MPRSGIDYLRSRQRILVFSSAYHLLPKRLLLGKAIDNVPADHHEVVFMIHVVTVDQVLAQKIPELHEEHNLITGWKANNVLSTGLERWRWSAVSREDSEFLKVNVNGMRPIRSWNQVSEGPDFSRSFHSLV